MPIPIPPKPTLRMIPVPTAEVIAARKATWAAWEDECTMAQEALIESILFQIPSLAKSDG